MCETFDQDCTWFFENVVISIPWCSIGINLYWYSMCISVCSRHQLCTKTQTIFRKHLFQAIHVLFFCLLEGQIFQDSLDLISFKATHFVHFTPLGWCPYLPTGAPVPWSCWGKMGPEVSYAFHSVGVQQLTGLLLPINLPYPGKSTESTCCTSSFLRGNVWVNQRGAPTCRRNLFSYSGYQKYSWIQGPWKLEPYGPWTLYSWVLLITRVWV